MFLEKSSEKNAKDFELIAKYIVEGSKQITDTGIFGLTDLELILWIFLLIPFTILLLIIERSNND